MKTKKTPAISRGLTRLAIVLAALSPAGCSSDSRQGTEEKEKFGEIALSSVYTSSGQTGLKQAAFNESFPFLEDLDRFRKLHPNVSNLFLARARNANEALRAALRMRGATATMPSEERKWDLWLIAFFGFTTSEPIRWSVDSVEKSSSRIRINYSLADPNQVHTADSKEYFLLIPLANLQAGRYQLELRESRTKDVTLMRRVEVQASQE